jgi:hypothetical protein
VIVKEREQVMSALESLGVPVDGLDRAVGAALGARQAVTLFHPKSFPGTMLWGEGTAAFRRLMVGVHNWTYDELDGQPRTISPDGRIAVVVQTGDEWTGVDSPGRAPSTRHPKGAATKRKVTSNALQLELFSTASEAEEVEADLAPMTWVLLLAIVDGELRAELSLPEDISDAGYVVAWRTRVLLSSHPVDADDVVIAGDEGDSPSESDVAVAWR